VWESTHQRRWRGCYRLDQVQGGADCSVLQCVAACCDVSQCVAVCCGALRCVAVCCGVLRCVAMFCSTFVTPWRVEQCVMQERERKRQSERERERASASVCEIESARARAIENESVCDRVGEKQRERQVWGGYGQ